MQRRNHNHIRIATTECRHAAKIRRAAAGATHEHQLRTCNARGASCKLPARQLRSNVWSTVFTCSAGQCRLCNALRRILSSTVYHVVTMHFFLHPKGQYRICNAPQLILSNTVYHVDTKHCFCIPVGNIVYGMPHPQLILSSMVYHVVTKHRFCIPQARMVK